MPPHPSWHADPALQEALALGLDAPLPPETARLAGFLAQAFGSATLALIHYGSHAQGSGAAPESAHDFFVILEDYAAGYRSLVAAVPVRFSAASASRLNRLLPPNVIALREPSGSPPLTAKCAVLSLPDLTRACSARAPDLFVLARLFQQVQLAWSRDPVAREAVQTAILEARERTFAWGRCFLPRAFSPASYCRALLMTSYGAEIRPEVEERLDALIVSQREVLVPVYGALLRSLARRGRLVREGGLFRDARPPGPLERMLARTYLGASKLRATLRWAKYVALYDNWLDYLLRKVERRRGVSIELTARERRWPLLFLWPKAIRFLAQRPVPRR